MRYRSKPAEVEAILWDGSNTDEVQAFLGDEGRLIQYDDGDAVLRRGELVNYFHAPRWIVRQPTGRRFLAPTPEIFAQRFEPIEEAAEPEPEHVRKPCEGFRWTGQPLASCDRCGLPAWEHERQEVMRPDASPFGCAAEDVEQVPWDGAMLKLHEDWKREQEAGK